MADTSAELTAFLYAISMGELIHALNRSVGMQRHYARLLNEHDGGRRIIFADARQWIERLREVEALKSAGPADSIVCPKCGARSYHPGDIAIRYCAACRMFHEAM